MALRTNIRAVGLKVVCVCVGVGVRGEVWSETLFRDIYSNLPLPIADSLQALAEHTAAALASTRFHGYHSLRPNG
jgi:hypothetical protein